MDYRYDLSIFSLIVDETLSIIESGPLIYIYNKLF